VTKEDVKVRCGKVLSRPDVEGAHRASIEIFAHSEGDIQTGKLSSGFVDLRDTYMFQTQKVTRTSRRPKLPSGAAGSSRLGDKTNS